MQYFNIILFAVLFTKFTQKNSTFHLNAYACSFMETFGDNNGHGHVYIEYRSPFEWNIRLTKTYIVKFLNYVNTLGAGHKAINSVSTRNCLLYAIINKTRTQRVRKNFSYNFRYWYIVTLYRCLVWQYYKSSFDIRWIKVTTALYCTHCSVLHTQQCVQDKNIWYA